MKQLKSQRTGQKVKVEEAGQWLGCADAEREESHRDDVQDAQQTVHTVTRKNLLHHGLCAILGQTKQKSTYYDDPWMAPRIVQ